MLYGYIRVSTKNQHEDRQVAALEPFNIPPENMFIEKQSGKDFARTKYKRLMRKLKPNDVLIIKSIDRLGRNYKEIIEQWRIITKEKGADVVVVDMPALDTTKYKDLLGTLIADIILQVMSFMAQAEREMMLQRQAEGIAAAKAKGVKWGHPKNLPEDFPDIYRRWRAGELTAKSAAALCNFSVSGLYHKMNQLKEAGEWDFE